MQYLYTCLECSETWKSHITPQECPSCGSTSICADESDVEPLEEFNIDGNQAVIVDDPDKEGCTDDLSFI